MELGYRMARIKLEFCRLRASEPYVAPQRSRAGDAGFDLFVSRYIQVFPNQNAQLPTNIAMAIPDDHFGLILPRSSSMFHGLLVSPGVIDSGYRGEIMVLVRNISDTSISLAEGDRVAQIIVTPKAWTTEFIEAKLSEGARGSNGFGSTGGYGGAA